MRFVWADNRHTQDILSLWKQGFPDDTEEDIHEFLKALRGEARCLLLQQDGETQSMAFVIPAALMHGGTSCSVWYVYAAVTATKSRGKGCFPVLLEEIVRCARDADVWGLFLRPGEPSLFDYYRRLGFHSAFSVESFSCKAKELFTEDIDLTWQKVTDNYAVCRRYWLSMCGIPHVLWSDRVTDYAVKHLEKGGMVVSTKGMAMYRCGDDKLTVTELLCKPQDRETVLASLARCFACQKLDVVTPSLSGENEQEYGMFRAVKAIDTANSGWYMGFSLE